MIEDRFIEIMNREIDGQADEQELAELRNYIARSPEARAYYDNIKGLSNILSQVEKIDPPPDMKHNIMTSIRKIRDTEKSRPEPARGSWSFLRDKFELKTVGAFGLGVAVSLIVLAVYIGINGVPSQIDTRDLSGSIILDETGNQLIALKTEEFNLGRAQGKIHSKLKNHIYFIGIEINSQIETKVLIKFDSNNYVFRGFETDKPPVSHINMGKNELDILSNGENKFVFLFENNSQVYSSAVVKIISGDEVYESEIPLKPIK